LPALETQLEMLQTGFKLGEMDLLDVMNARDRLLEVQRQSLDVFEEYVNAASRLEELLGISIAADN
jgi:outer membrane protein TolC